MSTEPHYVFGKFHLDPLKGRLRHDDTPVTLPNKVIQTLTYLVTHAGREVSKQELLDAVWPGRVVEEANISQNVFLLRRMFAEHGEDPQLIVTLPGRGYRFTGEVSVCTPPRAAGGNDASASPSASSGAPATQSVSGQRWWRWAFWPVASVLAGLVGAAVFWMLHARTRAPAAPMEVVLADFKNATGDPVFDAALDRAVAIDLAQSPFLKVLTRSEVGGELRSMGLGPEAPLPPDTAQQVCQRRQGQAVISGIIARLGEAYMLALGAVDCDSGERLAAVKTEVRRKEDVLPAIDRLSAQLRRQLGESAGSVRRHSLPLERVTTASLDALKAYSLATRLRYQGRETEALELFRQAVEFDPKFASAYAAIGVSYYNLGQPERAAPYLKQAYALRARTDAHEHFVIEALYYDLALADDKQAILTYNAWKQFYPRDATPWINLASDYLDIGDYAQAIAAAREAVRLAPGNYLSYENLAEAALGAGRLAEAQSACRQAFARGLDGVSLRGVLYRVGWLKGNPRLMAEQLAWAKGRAEQPLMLGIAANAAAAEGRMVQARRLFEQAVALARSESRSEWPAELREREIEALAAVGELREARALAGTTPGLDQLDDAPLLYAELGEDDRAVASVRAQSMRHPQATVTSNVRLPYVEASVALHRGRPQAALTRLQPALPYAWRDLRVPTLLAEALLRAGEAREAAEEYRDILAHPSVEVSPAYALAWLGLAQAESRLGDRQQAREAYRQFFARWARATPSLAVVREARREQSRLDSITASTPRR